MPSALMNIVKKELKEIFRDPRLFLGMVVIPMLMFPIMGLAMQGIMSETTRAVTTEINIAILNLDEGEIGGIILNDTGLRIVASQYNITLTYLNTLGVKDKETALQILSNNETIVALVVIPRNFTECIMNQQFIVIETYIALRELGFEASASGERVNIFLRIFEEVVSTYIIQNIDPNANPVFVRNPIIPETNTVCNGKVVRGVSPSMIVQMATFQLFMMPIASMMLLSVAIQFAATSVASEKEQKTLETLLTLPINRSVIVFGKLTGSLLVSILGTIGYMIGFQFYMSSITRNIPINQINLAELGLGIDLVGYILIGSSLFLSILSTLALITVIASFAEDVRSAQSLTGTIFVPIMMVGFFSTFALSFGKPGLWAAIMLFIPFMNPMIVPMYLVQKDYTIVLISIIALIFETIASIHLAANFYSSEKILSARIRFGKRRRRREQEET